MKKCLYFISSEKDSKCALYSYTEKVSKYIGDVYGDIFSVDVVQSLKKSVFPIKSLLKLFSFNKRDVIVVEYAADYFGSFFKFFGYFTFGFFFFCWLKRLNVITTVHEIFDYRRESRFLVRFFYRIYYGMVYWSIVRFSKFVTVHNEESKLLLRSYGCYSNNIIILRHPFLYDVNTACVSFQPFDSFVKSGDIVISLIGFIRNSKDYEFVINWLARYHKDDNLKLVICGQADAQSLDYLNKLKLCVDKWSLGNKVSFLGFLDDDVLKYVVKKADLFVFPYKDNTQSGAVFFPLLFNKSVLATDIGGFKEIKKDYGCIETFSLDDMVMFEKLFLKLRSKNFKVDETLTAKFVKENSLDYYSLELVNLIKRNS